MGEYPHGEESCDEGCHHKMEQDWGSDKVMVLCDDKVVEWIDDKVLVKVDNIETVDFDGKSLVYMVKR